MRFDSISVLGAVRPHAITPAPAHHHTQSGLSPFLTQPAHHNAVLTIRATYCIWLFLDSFLRLLHLHRIVCQSVPATPSSYYHSTKHFSSLVRSSVVDYPYSIRTDLFHTTFQNFTNSLQIRYFRLTNTRSKTYSARYLYKRRLFFQYKRVHDPPAHIDLGRNSIQYTAKQFYHCKWQGTLTP